MLRCLVLVIVILATSSLAAADWRATMGSLWGGAGDQQFQACVVTEDGVALVGGSGVQATSGVPVHDHGGRAGVILRIDTMLGELLSVATFASPVTSLALSDDGHVFASAGTVFKLSLDTATALWRGGSGGKRIARDGAGGVWTWNRGSAIRLDASGKQIASVGIGSKSKDFAVDPDNQLLFTCGFNAGRSKKSGNPVHVPWVRAYDFAGSRVWQMYGFTPTEVDEVSDMADSHPQRLFFGDDGHLYMFGDSDGGNTPYRHGPHKPGESVGNALKGTAFNEMWRAFRSSRMLFVCRIDPSSGDVLRGSFFYGMWHNEEQNRKEVGDSQAMGLYADKDGRVFLSGVMRCTLPWTPTAVHKESAPMDRRGYYNNTTSADEMFATIIDEDFSNLAFCSGFNQGDQGIYHSRGLCIAGNDSGAVVVGYMKQPETNATPASATAWLERPLQEVYGGGKDGYVATLSTRRPPTDPVALVRLLLERIYPDVAGPAVDMLKTSTDFGAAIALLREAGDERSGMVADMVERVGAQTLARADAGRDKDPVISRDQYTQLAASFAGADLAITATERLELLKKDKQLKKLIKAGEDKLDFFALTDGLVTVADAELASYLDAAYLKKNGKILKKMQSAAAKMHRSWPGHRYTDEVLATCRAYQLPVTKPELEMFKELSIIQKARRSLPDGIRRKVDWSDEKTRKRYKRGLSAIEKSLTAIRAIDAEHAFSKRATTIAAGVGIELGKKKKR